MDAVVFPSSGAISLVRRNHHGNLLGVIVRKYPNIRDPTTLEVLVIRKAFTWIKDRNVDNVIIELDCLTAVKDINNSEIMSSNYGLLIFEYQDILATLVSVRVVYVRRSANLVAYNLVRAKVSSQVSMFGVLLLQVVLLLVSLQI